jgi:hypothetical protein
MTRAAVTWASTVSGEEHGGRTGSGVTTATRSCLGEIGTRLVPAGGLSSLLTNGKNPAFAGLSLIAGEPFGSISDLVVPIEWTADLAQSARK